jgi:phosphoribosylanthranilate isomerase
MTRVKICGITSIKDARAAVAAGADAIGLVFYARSPRAVSIEVAQAICEEIPPFVSRVALFVDADEPFVRQVLGSVPIDVLQFHGDEAAQFCASFGRNYLKAVRVRPGLDLLEFAARYRSASGLLLDAFVAGQHGGTGQRFDWDLIPSGLPRPLVLSGGLTPENVSEAVSRVRPWAVDVSSGVESAPGKKDHLKIQQFIERARHGNARSF